MQHHDAITGTAMRKVAYDYYRKVQSAEEQTNELNELILRQQLSEKGLNVSKIEQSLNFTESNNKRFSHYMFAKEFLVVVSSPG